MAEIVVVEAGLDESLDNFSRYLWEQGVSHRLVQYQGRQLLLVGNKNVAIQVRSVYEAFQRGEDVLPAIELPGHDDFGESISRAFGLSPVTLVFVFLSVLGFLLVYFDRGFDWVRYLTFYDFDREGAKVVFSLPRTDYWRLITPIFLHFGLMHIAFNMSLLWFAGRQIEALQGSYRMLGLSLLIGLGSNIMQAMTGVAIFGGMSGVVYGLLGYAWIWNLMRPDKKLFVPNVIFYFSLAMLLLGFTGLIGLIGPGKIANVAHLGGLVIGLIMGLGAALIDKHTKL